MLRPVMLPTMAVASSSCSPSSALPLPFSGSVFSKKAHCKHHVGFRLKTSCFQLLCSALDPQTNVSEMELLRDETIALTGRRNAVGLGLIVSTIGLIPTGAEGAGLPPEEKPRLCDDACEKELENVPMVTTESGLQYKDIKVGNGPSPPIGFQVAANYVAMLPSGQIFDSSLEKGLPYLFRVGSGQVIKGLDEGILSMKVGGKRRLYIPGPLAFPKGLNSAPGRPRVAPNSPVVFDVSLEYIPGLEDEE